MGAGDIMTVTGPIDPDLLGLTLMHEHVLCDLTNPKWRAGEPADLAITLAAGTNSITALWSRATRAAGHGHRGP